MGPVRHRRCTHWDETTQRYCGSTHTVRPYLTGPRCPLHTPSALAGRPEAPPGPGLPASAWSTLSPLSASRVHDARAIASGKRRAHHHAEYRAAQAAVSDTHQQDGHST